MADTGPGSSRTAPEFSPSGNAGPAENEVDEEELAAEQFHGNTNEENCSRNESSSPPVPKKFRADHDLRDGQRAVDSDDESTFDKANVDARRTIITSSENPALNGNASYSFNPIAPYFHPPIHMMMPGFFPPPAAGLGMMMPGQAMNPYFPYQYPPPASSQQVENSGAESTPKAFDQGTPQRSDKASTASESPSADTPAQMLQSTPGGLGWGSPTVSPPSFPYPPMPSHPQHPMMHGGAMMYPPHAAYFFGVGGFPPSRGVPLSLALDQERLSEYQIAIRRQLELFEATVEDVESNTQGRKKAVKAGQVGLRCRHCVPLPLRMRGRGAVYYPSTLLAVYQAAQNMASSHLCLACTAIPPGLKDELIRLRERKDNAGGGKQYWADACRAQGVVEVNDGLIFRRMPQGGGDAHKKG